MNLRDCSWRDAEVVLELIIMLNQWAHIETKRDMGEMYILASLLGL